MCMQAARHAARHTWQQQHCSRNRQTAYAEVSLESVFLQGSLRASFAFLGCYGVSPMIGLQASSSSADGPGEIPDEEVTGSDAWRRRPAAVRSCTQTLSIPR